MAYNSLLVRLEHTLIECSSLIDYEVLIPRVSRGVSTDIQKRKQILKTKLSSRIAVVEVTLNTLIGLSIWPFSDDAGSTECS